MSDVQFNPGEPQFTGGDYRGAKQSALVGLAMKIMGTDDEAKANLFLLVVAVVCLVAAAVIYFIFS